MAKRRGIASITAEQAQNVLTYLVHEGRITAKAVERALGQREKLIREIRDRMAALGGAAAEGFRQAEKVSRKPRRKAASAATRAARKAQGQYMAAVRRLSKSARKQIKAIRLKSGVKAAIAKAKRMAK